MVLCGYLLFFSFFVLLTYISVLYVFRIIIDPSWESLKVFKIEDVERWMSSLRSAGVFWCCWLWWIGIQAYSLPNTGTSFFGGHLWILVGGDIVKLRFDTVLAVSLSQSLLVLLVSSQVLSLAEIFLGDGYWENSLDFVRQSLLPNNRNLKEFGWLHMSAFYSFNPGYFYPHPTTQLPQ